MPSHEQGDSRSWEKQPGYKADMKRAMCVCDMEAGDGSSFFACLIGRDAVRCGGASLKDFVYTARYSSILFSVARALF